MKVLERLSLGATAVGIASGLALSSSPNIDWSQDLFSRIVVAATGFFVLTCLFSAAIAGRARAWARLRFLALHMALVLAAFALTRTYWPLRARLLVSDPFIRPIAHAALQAPQSDHSEYRAGLFGFGLNSRPPDAALLVTGDCGFFSFDTCGFVYSPDGQPVAQPREELQHLYGPWWHYWYHE
jgi:hypothetical protein